jgi:hypothetical protein
MHRMSETAAQDARRLQRRVLVVALLILAWASLWGPDLRRAFGHPLGELGFATDVDGKVVAVEPKAREAGVRVGDVIDLRKMSFRDRFFVLLAQRTLDPGTTLTVPVLRSSRDVFATIVTTPEPVAAIRSAEARIAFTILFMALGALVVLRRPSAATWAFFAYALEAASPPVNVVNLAGPAWWLLVAVNLAFVSQGMKWALVIFAILLLHEGALPRWRRLALAATAALVIVMVLAVAVYVIESALGTPSPAAFWTAYTLFVLPLFVAAGVLAATSYESSPAVRQRLRWVIAGVVAGAIATAVAYGSTQFGLGLYPLTYAQFSLALIVAGLAVGTTVAYAILKHRIVDVNVALSRALVYTLISAIVVGAFALVELFFTNVFEASRAGLFADIGLALILGFSFNSMHARVDRFVDGLLFRSRHLAERHLETVIHSMPYARNREHVDRLLVDEPVRAFALEGARVAPVIDGIVDCGLDRSDSLVTYLKAERKALRLNEHGYACEWAVAIGVFSRASLAAIVFYGAHRDTTDLDGDEVALLERLADATGTAYDRLEAETLRARVAVLEAELGNSAPAVGD